MDGKIEWDRPGETFARLPPERGRGVPGPVRIAHPNGGASRTAQGLRSPQRSVPLRLPDVRVAYHTCFEGETRQQWGYPLNALKVFLPGLKMENGGPRTAKCYQPLNDRSARRFVPRFDRLFGQKLQLRPSRGGHHEPHSFKRLPIWSGKPCALRVKLKMSLKATHGGYSSAGRALDCGSSGRGFEPLYPPHIFHWVTSFRLGFSGSPVLKPVTFEPLR